MRKREQFAVSLRKQKTRQIIANKRKRIAKVVEESTTAEETVVGQASDAVLVVGGHDFREPSYNGYFVMMGKDRDYFNGLIRDIAPELASKSQVEDKINYAIYQLQTIEKDGGGAGEEDQQLQKKVALFEVMRKILQVNEDPSIGLVIQRTPLVQIVVNILGSSNFQSESLEEKCLKLEALWILINLTYTDEFNTMLILCSELDKVGNISKAEK